MPNPLIPALLALALPVFAASDGVDGTDGTDGGGGQIATMTIHERIVVRVPRLGAPPQQFGYKEAKGPKCIAASELAGALVPAPAIVDLVLKGNRRIRARLNDDCEPLAFYSGFYLKPAGDGKVCAGRDSIRTRSGSACRIDTFKLLKPVAIKR